MTRQCVAAILAVGFLGPFDQSVGIHPPRESSLSTFVRFPPNAGVAAIAVDADRNLYAVGTTRDPAFVTTPGVLNRRCGSDNDCGSSYHPFHRRTGHAILMKFAPNGSLTLSTFIGGDGDVQPNSVAIGPDGSIYVAGDFGRSFYPVPQQFPLVRSNVSACGEFDAFIARLTPDASSLIFATCIQGPSEQQTIRLNGMAVDSAGAAAIGGYVNNPDFPLTNAIEPVYRGHPAFVTKLEADGRVRFSTTLGGSVRAAVWGIATDADGNVVVVGDTESQDFPVERPFRRSLQGVTDGFVAKLDRNGRSLIFSTYLGGDFTDVIWGVAVDDNGDAWVVGDTHSTNFPTTADARRPVSLCGADLGCTTRNPSAFAARFDAIGRLAYSTLIGPQTVIPSAPGGARLTNVFAGRQRVHLIGDSAGDVPLVRPLTDQPCDVGVCGWLMTAATTTGLQVQFASRLKIGGHLVALEAVPPRSAMGAQGELYLLAPTDVLEQQQVVVIELDRSRRGF